MSHKIYLSMNTAHTSIHI